MAEVHEYMNLLSGLFDLLIAGMIFWTTRRLQLGMPRVTMVLIAFFVVSGLSYLNEPSPVFGTHPTLAVVLDVARIAMLALLLYASPRLARIILDSIKRGAYERSERERARMDLFYDM